MASEPHMATNMYALCLKQQCTGLCGPVGLGAASQVRDPGSIPGQVNSKFCSKNYNINSYTCSTCSK